MSSVPRRHRHRAAHDAFRALVCGTASNIQPITIYPLFSPIAPLGCRHIQCRGNSYMEACGTARRHSLPVWLPSFFTSRTNERWLIVLVVLRAYCESLHASPPANTWRLDVEKMGRTSRPKNLICIRPACLQINASRGIPRSFS